MGLFDKVMGKRSNELDVAESFLAVALCAVAADGVITEEEAMGLQASLGRMQAFAKWDGKTLKKAMEKIVRSLHEGGVEAVLPAAAKALPKELRPTAFAVAADLLLMDGDVADTERAFLEALQKALAVEDALAVKIVEVLEIKNRG